MSASQPGFDRVRRRRLADGHLGQPQQGADPEGRRLLFSREAETQPATLGSVTLTCSACGERSAVGLHQAALLAVPSLHLPVLRRDFPSWMRCPACGRRTWLRATLNL